MDGLKEMQTCLVWFCLLFTTSNISAPFPSGHCHFHIIKEWCGLMYYIEEEKKLHPFKTSVRHPNAQLIWERTFNGQVEETWNSFDQLTMLQRHEYICEILWIDRARRHSKFCRQCVSLSLLMCWPKDSHSNDNKLLYNEFRINKNLRELQLCIRSGDICHSLTGEKWLRLRLGFSMSFLYNI